MRKRAVGVGCVGSMVAALQNEDWWKGHTEELPLGCLEVTVDGVNYIGTPESRYKGPRPDGQLTAVGSDGIRYVLEPRKVKLTLVDGGAAIR